MERFLQTGHRVSQSHGLLTMCLDVDVYVGRRLFEKRRALQLTQAELGRMVGVAFQTIQKYECATTRVSAARLWELSRAMGVTLDYFFDGLDGGSTAIGRGAPQRPRQ
jgi:transcriptional regulator with XRE-family HTH domain